MPTTLFLRNPSNQKSWLGHSTLTCAQNAYRGLYPDFASWLIHAMTISATRQCWWWQKRGLLLQKLAKSAGILQVP